MCAERLYGFVMWLVVESVIQWVSGYSAVMISVSCQLSLNLARSHWTHVCNHWSQQGDSTVQNVTVGHDRT